VSHAVRLNRWPLLRFPLVPVYAARALPLTNFSPHAEGKSDIFLLAIGKPLKGKTTMGPLDVETAYFRSGWPTIRTGAAYSGNRKFRLP